MNTNYINFQPSKRLKKLQKIELNMLKDLLKVCKKYNLKCWASGGTLIGAVRHNGFIPWDDDIDLQMLWEDYKILIEVAPKEFSYPLFFQCYKTDINAEVSHARLRNSETTGCTKWDYENIKSPTYNRGIFIDIFPLFPIPDNENTRIIQKQNIDETWKAIRGWNALQNINKGYSSVYEKYIPYWTKMSKQYTISKVKQLYIDACAIENGNTENIGMTSFRTNSEKHIWEKKCFVNSIELPFEDIAISCPIGYDEILSKTYGDWRTPVFDCSIHEMYLFDTEVPFSEKTDFFI